MKIFILGISGMLGNTLYRYFSSRNNTQTYGTLRSSSHLGFFDQSIQKNIIPNIDSYNTDLLWQTINEVKPDVVINCIGVIKQLEKAYNPLESIPINSLFPHQLAAFCKDVNARLVHISTDCVFSGSKGNYKESDAPDATDLYGRSKLLGEVYYPHAITLRTSIIGHELNSSRSLVDWFLSQKGEVKGFKRAVFSGLPTIELARIIHDYVLPRPELNGLYQVAAEPINKYDLLNLIKEVYNKDIKINPSDELIVDKSLDGTRFNNATGYIPPTWGELIESMHNSKLPEGRHV
jgi:dTDP-4-dehydrorhamnose reductase